MCRESFRDVLLTRFCSLYGEARGKSNGEGSSEAGRLRSRVFPARERPVLASDGSLSPLELGTRVMIDGWNSVTISEIK